MRLQKSVNVSQAVVGDTLTFTIQWVNDAAGTVSYQIWDSLSPFLSYLGCDNGCTASGQFVAWNFSAPPGSSGQVALWARINGAP